MFAVNSLRVRRCWQSANLIAKLCPKCIRKYATIHQKSCKIDPKSTKMGPRSAPKVTLGASRLEVAKKGATAFHKFEIIGATWAILVAIWPQLGVKGVPKSSNSAPRCAKSRKNCVQEGLLEKVWIVDWIFIDKGEAWRPQIIVFTAVLQCFCGFSILWRNQEFHEAKNDPKSEHKIDLWAIRGPTFEVLGGFLKSLIFDEFSNGEKSA